MNLVTFLRISKTLAVVLLGMMILVTNAYTSDWPFNNAANWGGTGLMEMPNARILEDGVVRFEATQALPYRWFSGAMGILPRLEFSARLTTITDIPAFGPNSGYGAYKDKAFDLKYQLIPESKEWPAIALGFNDFWGTRLFASEYLAMSRQIYPFDFTLGIGSKRFSGGSINFDNHKYSLFGGFELELNDWLHFMAEYNSIKYENDDPRARGVPQGAKWPINVGIRARLLKGIEMGLSYQRGDTLGISLSVTSLLGAQILPQRPNPPPLLPVDTRPFSERNEKKMLSGVYNAVIKAGFTDVVVYTNGKNVICEFENNKYLSNQKAVGRILRILLYNSPEDANLLIAVVKSDNIPILKVSVKPDYLNKYLLGEIPEDIFMNKLLHVNITDKAVSSNNAAYIKIAEDMGLNFKYDIKPDVSIYWNDPSGFMKFTAGLAPYFTMNLWKGASAIAQYTIPFYSDVSSPSTEELPPTVIMSDISKYLEGNYTFEMLEINQIFRMSDRLFGRLNLGYFDRMYAGIGGGALYFPGDGKMAFGIEGDLVRKRVPKTQLQLMSFNRYDVLGSAYYYFSGLNMTFKLQYGRFLAGDMGWKIDISRVYKTGVRLGMFITYTDTNNINQPSFNNGYHNKGVYLNLPIRMFYDHDSPRMLNYGISPWTRDVGQTVPHWKDLYSVAGDLMPARFKAETDEMKK